MNAAEIVKALGGRNGMARCPVHKGGKERTPSLKVSGSPDGKILVHCKAGCPQETVWQALKDLGLVGNGDTRRHTALRRRHEKTPAQRHAEALAVWETSEPAPHTPVQAYLERRGITIELPAPSGIRHHRVALFSALDGLQTDQRYRNASSSLN